MGFISNIYFILGKKMYKVITTLPNIDTAKLAKLLDTAILVESAFAYGLNN